MRHVLSLIFLIISFMNFSQSSINNLDFEDGNFNNWTTINGTVLEPFGHGLHPFVFSSFGVLNPGDYYNASHLIIDSNHNDTNLNNLKALCPYTNSNSLRLGDYTGGSNATRIERIITIDSLILDLDFFFALIMDNPSHPVQEQPYIFVQLFDSSSGNLIGIDSLFIEGGDQRLIRNNGSQRYLDWSHHKFDLRTYVGRKVLIRVTYGDCGYGAHDGRVYLDFSMNPKYQFITKDLCSTSDSVLFRGKSYDSVGVYKDTVWLGSNVDSIFTLFIRSVNTTPTNAKLSYNLCKSKYNYTIYCNLIGAYTGSVNYEWFINGVSFQTGQSNWLNKNFGAIDTIICKISSFSTNCFSIVSDTLIIDRVINPPLVNILPSTMNLTAIISGGKAPYKYNWEVNSIPILVNDSIITPATSGNYYVTVVDAYGCKTKDSLLAHITGISENNLKLQLRFYPNPAANSIYIELNGEQGVIEIIDLQGKLIQKSRINRDGELKFNEIVKGVYLLRFITNDNNSITKKLVIE